MVSLLIVPITLRAGDALAAGSAKTALMTVLHGLTKVFYYPLLGHALYPRHWFPGAWITVVILFNSVLVGALLAGVVAGCRRVRACR